MEKYERNLEYIREVYEIFNADLTLRLHGQPPIYELIQLETMAKELVRVAAELKKISAELKRPPSGRRKVAEVAAKKTGVHIAKILTERMSHLPAMQEIDFSYLELEPEDPTLTYFPQYLVGIGITPNMFDEQEMVIRLPEFRDAYLTVMPRNAISAVMFGYAEDPSLVAAAELVPTLETLSAGTGEDATDTVDELAYLAGIGYVDFSTITVPMRTTLRGFNRRDLVRSSDNGIAAFLLGLSRRTGLHA